MGPRNLGASTCLLLPEVTVGEVTGQVAGPPWAPVCGSCPRRMSQIGELEEDPEGLEVCTVTAWAYTPTVSFSWRAELLFSYVYYISKPLFCFSSFIYFKLYF